MWHPQRHGRMAMNGSANGVALALHAAHRSASACRSHTSPARERWTHVAIHVLKTLESMHFPIDRGQRRDHRDPRAHRDATHIDQCIRQRRTVLTCQVTIN